MTTPDISPTLAIDTAAQASGESLSKARTALGWETMHKDSPGGAAEAAIGAVNQAIGNALRSAEAAAVNNRIPAEGREASVNETARHLADTVSSQVRTAEAATAIVRAELYMKALPQVPKDGESMARSSFEAILRNTPAEKRGEVLRQVMQADSDVAGAACSQFGRDLSTMAFGLDPDVYEATRTAAVEAGASSLDPKRRAAAEAYRASNELVKARQAASMAADAASRYLQGIAQKAAYDPRDAEIRRLREKLSKLEGHAQ